MFRPPADAPALVGVRVAGVAVRLPAGASAAAALLVADAPRATAVSGAPRLPYCMMGVCFDCLATIDGVPNRQACLVPIHEGMEIEPQQGARAVETGA